VEEENLEDEGVDYLNLRRRQARFKLIQDKNEFNKKNKRNRSTEIFKDSDQLDIKMAPLNNQCLGVSEDEEEEASESSDEQRPLQVNKLKRYKTYSIGYLTKNIWSKKIYSDDFDVDFEILKNN
jgi:hypothetical protein